MNYASPARARLTESALRYIARFFFAAVALTAVGSAAIFMSLPPDIPIGRRDPTDAWRTISVSGEPRFDASRRFQGYWGVARDVTDELRAQHAVAASETRYRELFERSPSALLLHRHGRLISANDAAARVFGYSHTAAMQGLPMVGLSRFEATHRQVVERLTVLDTLQVGEGLDVWDIEFRTYAGERRHVQSTAVRVEAAGGRANLSLLFDITARSAAEAALRRSEALFSHVFANSPDGVTLTELPSGRYVLVNEAFSRISGLHHQRDHRPDRDRVGHLERPRRARSDARPAGARRPG